MYQCLTYTLPAGDGGHLQRLRRPFGANKGTFWPAPPGRLRKELDRDTRPHGAVLARSRNADAPAVGVPPTPGSSSSSYMHHGSSLQWGLRSALGALSLRFIRCIAHQDLHTCKPLLRIVCKCVFSCCLV